MPWFYVEEVENGGVFNYQIKNHLVEVRDPDDLSVLHKEPQRFRELSKREVAALKRPATFSSTSSTDEELVDEEEAVSITKIDETAVADAENPKIIDTSSMLETPPAVVENKLKVKKAKITKKVRK